MKNIKIILWGLGAMGSGMAKDLLVNKQGIEIVGAIGQNPAKIGKDLGETLGLAPIGVTISGNSAEVLEKDADIVLLSTASFTEEVFPQIKQIIEAGKNIITIAEEMSAPQAQQPQLAAQIDELAQ